MIDDVAKELLALSGASDIAAAATALGLATDSDFRIVRASDWRRGGAETYILDFDAKNHGRADTYLLKACTPSVGPGSLQKVFARWLARRQLVAEHGVRAPRLFGAKDAILLEEYVGHGLVDVLAHLDDRAGMCRRVGRTAGILDRLGFRPVALATDLRYDGTDVVLTDFGEDLGEPEQGAAGDSDVLAAGIARELTGCGLSLNDRELLAIREGIVAG